jgi:hypothetical protein
VPSWARRDVLHFFVGPNDYIAAVQEAVEAIAINSLNTETRTCSRDQVALFLFHRGGSFKQRDRPLTCGPNDGPRLSAATDSSRSGHFSRPVRGLDDIKHL